MELYVVSYKPEPLLDQCGHGIIIIYRFSSLNKSQLKEALNTYTAMKYLDMIIIIIMPRSPWPPCSYLQVWWRCGLSP